MSTAPDVPKKGSAFRAVLLSAFLLLLGGAGGAFAVSLGLLGENSPLGLSNSQAAPTFVPLEPLTVVLSRDSQRRFLRFSAEVEVANGKTSSVTSVMPRITDVLNTYLRSVSIADVEDPASMLEIRSQILRRLQLVVGEDVVKDLLVTEYVVN